MEVFIAALDRQPGPERTAYLDSACGDRDDLRRRVEDLLAAHERADEVLGLARGPAEATATAGETAAPTSGLEIESTQAAETQATAGNARAERTLEPVAHGATATSADARVGDGLPRGTAVRYFGDYEIDAELGRGGMGVVYRARQVSLNRPVALKMLRAGVLAGDAELQRFQNEAEAVALLDHPGIVPVYEVGQHDGQRYFSMKLIPGGNLADLLESSRDDSRTAAALLAEAAEAVHYAHMRGILHRDLKPANILVDDQGRPHVTDFGLAKRLDLDVELTQSGAVMGTPGYMSPEQANGRRGTITTATDVYGLGAVLYALLTGKAPFSGESVVDTLTRVKEQPPEPPRKHNPKLPRDLDVICLKCLEKDPRRRYSSAAALADDLRAWLESRPIAARAVGTLERAALFVHRKPVLAAAYGLTAAVVFLLGFGGTIARLWRAAENARAEAVVAHDDEKKARLVAEQARDGEKSARQRLAAIEYGRTMEVAHQEWRDGNIGATVSLIESTPAALRGWEWRYINRLCHSDILTLRGHSLAVCSACYSPDGSRVATASADNTAKIWDATTGVEILTLRGHSDTVFSASFSPDGSRVVTTSHDRSARVWDARTGAQILTLKGRSSWFYSASYSPDGLRIVTSDYPDYTAKVWDARTGTEVLTFKGHKWRVGSATFSPDGSRVVTASWDGSVKLWDAKTGAEVHTFAGHTGRVFSASFSPDGLRVVSASQDGTAKVWDARTGVVTLSFMSYAFGFQTASFSPDGSLIVTTGDDNTPKVWDARTGTEVLTLRGHTERVGSASFSPDGSRVVTAGDKTAKIWVPRTRAEALTLSEDNHPGSASFSPDGSRILTVDSDRTAKVRDAATGAEVLALKAHTDAVSGAFFSPDGSRILTTSHDRTAKVWDASTGTEVQTFHGHSSVLWAGSFSPDGLKIVTASSDGTARVWDARTGVEILNLKGHGDNLRTAVFSPDGLRILTASFGDMAKVWDATTGVEILTLKGQAEGFSSGAFSPDGLRIVTASVDKTAKVWDADTGVEILSLTGHTAGVISASFSPDGSRVVTASMDKTAKVWDAKTGSEVLTLKGHTGILESAAFSPDGSRIVTASQLGTTMVWDARPFALVEANRPKGLP
jgi:WD40 repeat protein